MQCVTAAGLRRILCERERGVAGEREAPRLKVWLPPPSPLYIGPLGGADPRRWDLLGGRGAAKGEACPPRQVEAPPTLGFPTLGAGGPRGGRTSPLWAGSPPHFGPWGPPGWVAPPGGPPGPIRWSRYNTGDSESFPMAETALPIYNSSPPDHSGAPRHVRDLIRDSKLPSVTTYYFP